MKKILSVAVLILCTVIAFAQAQPLPNDPEVKTGKLENGMTYYIRHNALPEGRCEFYLATHVGAIQETPDQDGLAHFLEHMCFNGLKNLPGKQMLEYLQHIGAEFGRNINASTGVERTQYMLNNMPVTREGILDTCLLVMHDYSHFVLNDPKEIDAERGVILEEKRTRNNAGWRMHEQAMPYMYGKDCKYAGCTIIGSEENLKTFKPESLTNFYKTWYQPDMQALIIVGDINVDQVYNKVVKLFSDIPAPAQPTVKNMPKVEMNEKPVVGILTDPENTATEVEFIWKTGEPTPRELRGTQIGYMERLIKRIVSGVMDERFNDITSKPDAPFLGASLGIYQLTETCEALYGGVQCDNAKTLAGSEAFLMEVEKMKRFGFNDDEISRVKDDIIKGLKNKVDNANARKNPEFIYPIMGHFFDGVSYLTPEMDLQVSQAILSQLNAGIINQILPQLFKEEHLVVLYTGSDKEGQFTPTEQQLLDIVEKVKTADIQANKAEKIDSDFMAGTTIKAGKVKKETKGLYGATQWTLSNGLNVVVLPTQHKKDQVIMRLRRNGGISLVPTEDLMSMESNIAQLFTANSGIAGFPCSTVSKMLSGKTVSVTPVIQEHQSGINASCAPEDIETALQLLNLNFTNPRFDQDEWNTGINQINAVLPNLISTPNFALQQHIYKDIYNSPRKVLISPEVVEKANLQTYEKNYRTMFSDIAGATLYIVGNVDPASIKPLVAKYCGSLAKGKKAAKWNLDNIPSAVKGEARDIFNQTMKTPKATVLQVYTADVPYTIQKEVDLNAAKFILDMIYTETLREEEGGTYGASAMANINFEPRSEAMVQVYFDTNTEQQEKLRTLAINGMKGLAENGPTTEQLTRAIENAKKNVPEKRISNSYWLNALKLSADLGVDYDAEYEKAVNNISAEGIKAVLSEILSQGNMQEIVMLP